MKNHAPAAAASEKSADRLCDDLREIVTEAQTMLKEAAPELSAATVASLRARCAASKARLAELCADAENQCAQGVEKVEARLRAKPYQSLALVVGVALAVGLLTYRGRQKSAACAVPQ